MARNSRASLNILKLSNATTRFIFVSNQESNILFRQRALPNAVRSVRQSELTVEEGGRGEAERDGSAGHGRRGPWCWDSEAKTPKQVMSLRAGERGREDRDPRGPRVCGSEPARLQLPSTGKLERYQSLGLSALTYNGWGCPLRYKILEAERGL